MAGSSGSVSQPANSTASTASSISADKYTRHKQIFDTLDQDQDGRVRFEDVKRHLHLSAPSGTNRTSPRITAAIKRVMFYADSNRDDSISFEEFVQYAEDHEKELVKEFTQLDRNRDGKVDAQELMRYFKSVDAPLTSEEADELIQQVSQRPGAKKLTLQEIHSFLVRRPYGYFIQGKDLPHHLRTDILKDIPDDFSEAEIKGGAVFYHLLAGFSAGIVSRTATAPLDRVKVYLQVNATKTNKLGFLSAIKVLLSEGGIKSLWRGNMVNCFKVAPESAMKFATYDIAKRFIKSSNVRWRGADPEAEVTGLQRFAAGSCAGVVSQTVIYPLETLKTRLILRRTGQLNHGLCTFVYKVYKAEGLGAFFFGLTPNLLGIIPYAGIDLAVYETLKNAYSRRYTNGEQPNPLVTLTCGATSSTCGQLVSYPLALIRTRLQAQTIAETPISGADATIRGQVKVILQTEGPTGFYRGLTPNLMKVLPAVSISYVTYETVRQWLGATMT